MVIHFGYSAKIVNAETTFLNGELEEEIYMECPKICKRCEKRIASF